MEDFQKILLEYLESDHIKKIREIREGRFGLNLISGMRNLTGEEIALLEKQNNTSENWNQILVCTDFRTDQISGNRFFGECYLGRFDGDMIDTGYNVLLPCGIFDSIIKGSVICNGAAVYRCGLISNYIISQGSVLYHNGSLTGGSGLSFGNGKMIPVGPETGERGIGIFAEMNMAVTGGVSEKKGAASIYREFLEKYTDLCRLDRGFVGEKCIIRDTVSITDSFIADGSQITGALSISGSTLLGSTGEPVSIGHGVEIKSSIIQHGCNVISGALISNTLMMEHSDSEKKCIISSSIIGPNSSIGEGEVTSTLAGPFTVAHHQSLLIACIWPSGRGNIGYGANVGSNHTSRLPDQEIFPGEGMFFGLGSSIKFPADFRKSPYSIISTGTITLPQRMEFPFSLITQPSEIQGSVPAMYNELKPGWVLAENLYTLLRNEAKYRKRNRARRDEFDFSIMRPDTVDMMITARDRLMSAQKKVLYTEHDIAGTGKNFITQAGASTGIETYGFFIRYYALHMYIKRAGRLIADGAFSFSENILSEDDGGIKGWSHAKMVLEREGLAEKNAAENIETFIEMTHRIYTKTLISRSKDYERGNKIISDYVLYHGLPENDPVIIEIRERTDIEIKRAEQMIRIFRK